MKLFSLKIGMIVFAEISMNFDGSTEKLSRGSIGLPNLSILLIFSGIRFVRFEQTIYSEQ
jgi:hypothetical protein